MATNSTSGRILRWLGAGLAVVLILGTCGLTSALAASNLSVVLPGLAGKEIDARVLGVQPADNKQMEITIDMGAQPNRDLDGYYAEVNGRRFSCQVSEDDAAVLICLGPAFAAGSTVELRLFNADDRSVYGTTLVLVQVLAQTGAGQANGGGLQAGGGSSSESGGQSDDENGTMSTVEGSAQQVGLLDLLNAALRINADVDAEVDNDVTADVNADVDADLNHNTYNTPTSACLLGVLCLEADVDVDARVDP